MNAVGSSLFWWGGLDGLTRLAGQLRQQLARQAWLDPARPARGRGD